MFHKLDVFNLHKKKSQIIYSIQQNLEHKDFHKYSTSIKKYCPALYVKFLCSWIIFVITFDVFGKNEVCFQELMCQGKGDGVLILISTQLVKTYQIIHVLVSLMYCRFVSLVYSCPFTNGCITKFPANLALRGIKIKLS